MALLEAGAHIDTVNSEGKAPYEVAKTGEWSFLILKHFTKRLDELALLLVVCYTGVAEIILKSQMKPSLQCIAAKTITKYNIPYCGSVSKNLENFIGLHGINKAYSGELWIEEFIFVCVAQWSNEGVSLL